MNLGSQCDLLNKLSEEIKAKVKDRQERYNQVGSGVDLLPSVPVTTESKLLGTATDARQNPFQKEDSD